MFCNKHNVNLLTAHLLAFGIEDAVVCPGSRNAVIVHNLLECSRAASAETPVRLHPVTDERSAAFVAIGIWLCTRRPVVVCVTSGSALLNLLPGVAEASFRAIPLVLISADRPPRWIGQLDGQTLPQPGALEPYAHTWQPDTESDLREALLATLIGGGQPVHINVPIDEPLFEFTTPALPPCLPYPAACAAEASPLSPQLLADIRSARHPAVIIGQYEDGALEALDVLRQHGWTIFAENISNQGIYNDELTDVGLLLHIGGALVEKRLKLLLRQQAGLTIVRIDATAECPETFGPVTHKVTMHPAAFLRQLAHDLYATPLAAAAPALTPAATAAHAATHRAAAVSGELQLPLAAFFVGNSTAVRWANKHLRVTAPTYCNRGVNGIEGSLSVAAGHALATDGTVLCLIGDLSFFYDCNALWNQRLGGNLRILLVNNNRGGIFYRLPGLDESPALDDYIAAQHDNDARGIAQSYRCTYLEATTSNLVDDIDGLVRRLLDTESSRPVVLEVRVD